jgi:hypothetical protein
MNTENIELDSPDFIKELNKKILNTILKAIRAYCGTIDDDDGKKQHIDVTIYENRLIIPKDKKTDSPNIIQFHLPEMCIKKSLLRPQLGSVLLNADVNYKILADWLKLYEKNVKFAKFGCDGIHLVVAKDLIEVSFKPNEYKQQVVKELEESIYEQIIDENQLTDPIPLPLEIPFETVVLQIENNQIDFQLGFNIDPSYQGYQIRLKKNFFTLKENQKITVYQGRNNSKIFVLVTITPAYTVYQYFRTLL